jgi:hypothetical protein
MSAESLTAHRGKIMERSEDTFLDIYLSVFVILKKINIAEMIVNKLDALFSIQRVAPRYQSLT